MSPSVLSLFSGAGGMDIGLEAAGFDHVGLVELDPIPRQTIRVNRNWPLIGNGDVNDVASAYRPAALGIEPGDLDLLAGGPPCQPFSMAAQWAAAGRQGMLDPRARTVTSTLRLIESFLPRAVLMENVAGFIRGRGSAIDYLRAEMGEINRRTGVRYKLHVGIVNAADYGVPQNRRRAMVVALRDSGDFQWPAPTFKDMPMTAWDALCDVPSVENLNAVGKWATLLPLIPPGHNYQWLTSKGGGPELFGYRTKFWNFLLKLSPDQPSWTLPASPGPSTGPFHWDDRPLTTQEQLRLQSFPDGWRLAGTLREQTRQIGNATPPLLAEVFGRAIVSALGEAVREPPTLLRDRASSPSPQPVVSTVVPREHAHRVGVKSPHRGPGLGPAAWSA